MSFYKEQNNQIATLYDNAGIVISIADGIVNIRGLSNVANVKWLLLV